MSQFDRPHPGNGSLPPGVHLPRPTVWPMALAGGIALLLGGIVLGLAFSAAGFVVIVLSIAGWIRELLRE